LRWYFGIDEAGSRTITGQCAKLAVQTAAALGGLEPVLLYYGRPTDFTAWMARQGVQVIATEPRFLAAIRAAEAAGTYRPHSIGHWLRLEIPLIERDHEFVLYTDCDVMFLRGVDWRTIRPRNLAAAPEMSLRNWRYFNGGVLVLNVAAMRASYEALEAMVCAGIARPLSYNYDDQVVLNEFYAGQWDRLDPLLNWKPYWGHDRRAAILHFHGPKLDMIEALTEGRWGRASPHEVFLANMLEASADAYIAWFNTLGDSLQSIDVSAALRFHRVASALVRHRPNIPAGVDRSFMTQA
jgi:hypothetical protein